MDKPITAPGRPPAEKRRHIPELTSIRAFGAFGVLLTHAAFWTGHYTDDWAGRLHGRWEIGVSLFFVLSAFLLTGHWMGALGAAHPRPDLRRYFLSRAKRVLPAYWIVVTVAYLVHLRDDPPAAGGGWEGWLRSMTFTQTLEFGWFHPGLSQMWSMVVEVGFYLVLPVVGLVMWAAARGRLRPVPVLGVIAVFGAIGPAWTVLSHTFSGPDTSSWLWPMGFFDWFAAGMLLAYGRQVGWRANLPLCWTLALASFLLATTPIAGPPTLIPPDAGQALAKTLLYGLTSALFVAPVALGAGRDGEGRAIAWLRHPALVWLGEISYEFFLVHVLVLDWTMGELGYATFRGSMAGAAIVTAVVSLPLAWLLRRATDVLTGRPGPASPFRPAFAGPGAAASRDDVHLHAERPPAPQRGMRP